MLGVFYAYTEEYERIDYFLNTKQKPLQYVRNRTS